MEIESLLRPFEEMRESGVPKIIKQQEEILEKIVALTAEFEEIQREIPQTDLQKEAERINGLCDRVESIQARCQAVTKRCNKLQAQLSQKLADANKTVPLIKYT